MARMGTKIQKLRLALIWLALALIMSSVVALPPTPAHAATPIYVNATTGNDAWDGQAPVWDGTHGPKQTIQAGISVVDAGGTVYIAAGAYTLNANVTLNKSITLSGPNAGISPRNGGPLRLPEAVVNGGAPGPFTGSSSYSFVLAVGITSLNVTGLKFTNFDGNVFASSLVPVTNVDFQQNIFDGNNGGLMYKFDVSVATTFQVMDNLIANHSMVGANTALFFLGNVANSHFDNNEVTNNPGRELINIYDQLTQTTINNNVLTNSNAVTYLFANASNVQINGNMFNTVPLSSVNNAVGNAIYVGTNDGRTVSNITIRDNTISNATGSGIIVATDTATSASISNVIIENNTILTTGNYGVRIDTTQNGTGAISGVTIKNNTLSNNTFSPILIYSRPNPNAGLNSVSGITIQDNTITIAASVLTAGTFRLIDLRNVAGTNTASGNSVTLSGTLPPATSAVQAIGIRGSRTGTINITHNTLNGGGVISNGSPTIPVTAVLIQSNDGTTGQIPATAVINATYNLITGFEDGVNVRDGVAAAYGGLVAGVDVNFNCNNIEDNSLYGIRSGPGELIDAENNWWGSASGPGPVGPGTGDTVSANVDYDPWLGLPFEQSPTCGGTPPATGIAIDTTATTAACPGNDPLTVDPGTKVAFCYAVRNTGQTYLCNINVADTTYGNIGTLPGPCAPGAACGSLPLDPVIEADTTTTGSVTAQPCDGQGNSLGLPNVTGQDPVTVLVRPPITISPATLPHGTVGTAYHQTLTASGGTAPYTFAVTAGTLPPGLTLSPDGVLSGTPTGAGTFTFTVTATDANGYTGSQTYTIKIVKLAPVGGYLVPVSMVELLAPWLGLAVLAVAAVAIRRFVR